LFNVYTFCAAAAVATPTIKLGDDAIVGAEHCGSQPPDAIDEMALWVRAKTTHAVAFH